ncbi:MAG: AtpZ/AtpI family protein [Chlorobi bacterium]|nr:AtpZ/AtpI family protein [Chlorobiota bacterium]
MTNRLLRTPTHTALRQLAPLATLGVELAVTVLAGGGLGWFLDRATEMRPVWTIIGFVFGVVAAIVQFIRTIARLDRQQLRQKSDNSAAGH